MKENRYNNNNIIIAGLDKVQPKSALNRQVKGIWNFVLWAKRQQTYLWQTTTSMFSCVFIICLFVSIDHDQAERVSLTMHCSKDNKLGTLSSHKFSYLLETEQIIAQLLADSASDSKLIECLASLSVVSNNISKELKDTLDARITNAFEFLDLSPDWSLLGENGIENYQSRNGKCCSSS